MIRISEVRKELEKIYSSFDLDFPKSTLAEVKSLKDRLYKEVTGTCTDIDPTLIELRSNLSTFLEKS